jgi:PPOX class probable F420-dependent enzyme
MPTTLPAEIRGQKYVSLATFRKNGVAVQTPIWFAEENGNLYFMTRSDSGKYKRIRNNPQAKVAPGTIRGKITGPEFPARVRLLPPEDWERARKAVRAKYWLARVPYLWSKNNVYMEITFEDVTSP